MTTPTGWHSFDETPPLDIGPGRLSKLCVCFGYIGDSAPIWHDPEGFFFSEWTGEHWRHRVTPKWWKIIDAPPGSFSAHLATYMPPSH